MKPLERRRLAGQDSRKAGGKAPGRRSAFIKAAVSALAATFAGAAYLAGPCTPKQEIAAQKSSREESKPGEKHSVSRLSKIRRVSFGQFPSSDQNSLLLERIEEDFPYESLDCEYVKSFPDPEEYEAMMNERAAEAPVIEKISEKPEELIKRSKSEKDIPTLLSSMEYLESLDLESDDASGPSDLSGEYFDLYMKGLDYRVNLVPERACMERTSHAVDLLKLCRSAIAEMMFADPKTTDPIISSLSKVQRSRIIGEYLALALASERPFVSSFDDIFRQLRPEEQASLLRSMESFGARSEDPPESLEIEPMPGYANEHARRGLRYMEYLRHLRRSLLDLK